jgi:hypothetical protein
MNVCDVNHEHFIPVRGGRAIVGVETPIFALLDVAIEQTLNVGADRGDPLLVLCPVLRMD